MRSRKAGIGSGKAVLRARVELVQDGLVFTSVSTPVLELLLAAEWSLLTKQRGQEGQNAPEPPRIRYTAGAGSACGMK